MLRLKDSNGNHANPNPKTEVIKLIADVNFVVLTFVERSSSDVIKNDRITLPVLKLDVDDSLNATVEPGKTMPIDVNSVVVVGDVSDHVKIHIHKTIETALDLVDVAENSCHLKVEH